MPRSYRLSCDYNRKSNLITFLPASAVPIPQNQSNRHCCFYQNPPRRTSWDRCSRFAANVTQKRQVLPINSAGPVKIANLTIPVVTSFIFGTRAIADGTGDRPDHVSGLSGLLSVRQYMVRVPTVDEYRQ